MKNKFGLQGYYFKNGVYSQVYIPTEISDDNKNKILGIIDGNVKWIDIDSNGVQVPDMEGYATIDYVNEMLQTSLGDISSILDNINDK